MNPVLVNLEKILLHMAALYTKLVSEGELKRQAIIDGEVGSLEEVLEREYMLLEQIEKAEGMRITLSQQAEVELCIPKEDRPVKISRIIESAGANAESLKKAREILRKKLHKFRYRNRQNEELLKASIAHVNDFMSMVKNASGKKTYNRNGGAMGANGLRFIDRTA